MEEERRRYTMPTAGMRGHAQRVTAVENREEPTLQKAEAEGFDFTSRKKAQLDRFWLEL